MHLRQAGLPALSVLALLASGCRESMTSPSVAGTYVLDRVGETPVPAVIFSDSHGTVRVITDTLVLGADGRGRFVRVQTIEPAGGSGPGAPTRVESPLHHEIVRWPAGPNARTVSRIAMTFMCPVGAACIEGPHLLGRRQGSSLVVDETFATDAPRHYRRVETPPTP